MTAAVTLLGRPSLMDGATPAYRFRSRKSWALLAYLLLAERPPSRARLAELLFDDAADPLGALRWNLAEVRRGLGPSATLEGDPVVLVLPPGALVDVHVLTRGTWADAVALPGLGSTLLESVDVRGAAGFGSWLLGEQQRVAAASEAVLHEAAQALMARGELAAALACARRVTDMSPLDENNQALLVRLLRMTGDDDAATEQHAAYTRLLDVELGVAPGPALASALSEPVRRPSPVTGTASIHAIIESGAAAVAAGSVGPGLTSLRSAIGLADLASDPLLQVRARVVLGETLVHSLRGMDEEGLAALYAADEIAADVGRRDLQAGIRAELGYVDFLRARYDRAQLWLDDALALGDGEQSVSAKAHAYLGSVASDRADYGAALDHLERAVSASAAAGEPRRRAYVESMVGRLHLLRGDLDLAAESLSRSIDTAEREHWLAFLPWPQAFLGEVELARGGADAAEAILEQAFARACQLGDPCWEGAAARGLALVAEARGETRLAFDLLVEARERCNRLADAYVWLDAYILDAQCSLGLRHGHPETATWAAAMHRLSSRTAMREMTVRALLHAAALGSSDAGDGARLLALGIDNPVLQELVPVSSPQP
jgi:DNA-binding SARP family transcriptional activator